MDFGGSVYPYIRVGLVAIVDARDKYAALAVSKVVNCYKYSRLGALPCPRNIYCTRHNMRMTRILWPVRSPLLLGTVHYLLGERREYCDSWHLGSAIPRMNRATYRSDGDLPFVKLPRNLNVCRILYTYSVGVILRPSCSQTFVHVHGGVSHSVDAVWNSRLRDDVGKATRPTDIV